MSEMDRCRMEQDGVHEMRLRCYTAESTRRKARALLDAEPTESNALLIRCVLRELLTDLEVVDELRAEGH